MDLNKHYQRSPDFIFRNILDELILVPVYKDVADLDCVYTLNEVGTTIWNLLEQPRTYLELESSLLEAYEAEPTQISSDLIKFLEDLKSLGAVLEQE